MPLLSAAHPSGQSVPRPRAPLVGPVAAHAACPSNVLPSARISPSVCDNLAASRLEALARWRDGACRTTNSAPYRRKGAYLTVRGRPARSADAFPTATITRITPPGSRYRSPRPRLAGPKPPPPLRRLTPTESTWSETPSGSRTSGGRGRPGSAIEASDELETSKMNHNVPGTASELASGGGWGLDADKRDRKALVAIAECTSTAPSPPPAMQHWPSNVFGFSCAAKRRLPEATVSQREFRY